MELKFSELPIGTKFRWYDTNNSYQVSMKIMPCKELVGGHLMDRNCVVISGHLVGMLGFYETGGRCPMMIKEDDLVRD